MMRWQAFFLVFVPWLAGLDTPAAQVPSSEELSPGIEGLVDLTLESRVYGNRCTIRVLLPPPYAGLAALYFVVARPGVIGHLCLQSPSLQVSDAKILSLARQLEVWP